MSQPFVGEIRMFAGNFSPSGWALCDGQLVAITQNEALFALVGTIYGGDGRTTFGLPDLRGRIPLHMGSGPGLSNRPIGSKAGNERETVTVSQLPTHTHQFSGVTQAGTAAVPTANAMAPVVAGNLYRTPAGGLPLVSLAPQAVGQTGGSQPHDNLMPTLCVNFIIALFGVFPSRS